MTPELLIIVRSTSAWRSVSRPRNRPGNASLGQLGQQRARKDEEPKTARNSTAVQAIEESVSIDEIDAAERLCFPAAQLKLDLLG